MSVKGFVKPSIIIMISVFLSCETAEDIGVQYELDTSTEVNFIEFTLPFSLTYIDSLRTDGGGRILVGNYSDELTGSISSEGYVNIAYESGSLPGDSIGEFYILDTAFMALKSVESISTAGEITSNGFSVSTLDTRLRNLVYLRQNTQIKNAIIGESTLGELSTEDSVVHSAGLSKSFQNSLFNLMRNDGVNTPSSFDGLSIAPTQNSNQINAYDLLNDTSRIYLKVINPLSSSSGTDTTYTGRFTLTNVNYSQLSRDRANSLITGISSSQNFNSITEEGIIDPAAGVTIYFGFEEFKSFIENNSDIIINNASVSIKFLESIERELLTNFTLALANEGGSFFGPAIAINQFSNIVMNDAAYLNPRLQSGQLNSIPISPTIVEEESILEFNSTLFFQNVLLNTASFSNNESLFFQSPVSPANRTFVNLIALSNNNLTLSRTLIPNDGVTLRLYYTKIK